MNKVIKLLLFLTIILSIIGMIFYFSDQDVTQSHSLSFKVSAFLTGIIADNFHSASLRTQDFTLITSFLDGPIRKLAHLFIYNVLGFFGYFLLWRLDNRRNSFRKIIAILLLVMVVATFDEINQYYSGGRGASMRDVFLDLFGGCFGIYLVFLLRDFKRHLMQGFSTLRHKS